MEPATSTYAPYFDLLVEVLKKFLASTGKTETELAHLAPQLRLCAPLNGARSQGGSYLPLLNAAADAGVIILRRSHPQNYVSLPAAAVSAPANLGGGVKEDGVAAIKRLHAEAMLRPDAGFKSWSAIEAFVKDYVNEAKRRTLHLSGLPQMSYNALRKSLVYHFRRGYSGDRSHFDGDDGGQRYIPMVFFFFMGRSGQNEAKITFNDEEDAEAALRSIQAEPRVFFKEFGGSTMKSFVGVVAAQDFIFPNHIWEELKNNFNILDTAGKQFEPPQLEPRLEPQSRLELPSDSTVGKMPPPGFYSSDEVHQRAKETLGPVLDALVRKQQDNLKKIAELNAQGLFFVKDIADTGFQYFYKAKPKNDHKGFILGQGSQGTVYIGQRTSSNSAAPAWVAVKKANSATSIYRTEERVILEKFNQEEVQQEHLLKYISYCEDSGGDEFLIMELGVGDLSARLDLCKQYKIGEDETLDTLRSLCSAVQTLHEIGVTHRDIRPQNFIITEKGKIKLADFGLSRVFQVDKKGATLNKTGSQGWDLQPPEARRAHLKQEKVSTRTFSTRVDIFMLGMTMYNFASGGDILYQPSDAPNWNPEQHPEEQEEKLWSAIVEKGLKDHIQDIRLRFLLRNMLSYDPNKRFTIDNVLSHPYFVDFHGLRSITDHLHSRISEFPNLISCKGVSEAHAEALESWKQKSVPQVLAKIRRTHKHGIGEVVEFMRHGLAHYLDPHKQNASEPPWALIHPLMVRDQHTGATWRFAGEYFFRHSSTAWVLPAFYDQNTQTEVLIAKQAELNELFRSPKQFQYNPDEGADGISLSSDDVSSASSSSSVDDSRDSDPTDVAIATQSSVDQAQVDDVNNLLLKGAINESVKPLE
eukprot:TRINITY_DN3_c0_g1_i6.p1 TRINITY_DN3_c0_g1~~TRINITY_DN3_c0_g1_i6.p1  ORF type:complete len:867 (+),score=155.88 TRINITY_DN3_c0_g1_i6:908-3508(+)